MKRLLRGAIEPLDHQNSKRDRAPFDTINPSAENIAKYFMQEISDGLHTGERR